MLLEWSTALRSDRTELGCFSCTEPGGRKVQRAGRWEPTHPRPWELRVQAVIRKFRPPVRPPEYALVGRDRDGIAAFVFWVELDGPGLVDIRVVAVARRLRGRGGGWASEMMRLVFDSLTARALDAGISEVGVLTWIHERNHPSQRMCHDLGMAHTGEAMNGDPALQRWATRLLVGGADIDAP